MNHTTIPAFILSIFGETLASSQHLFKDFWNYELFATPDNYPITSGKILSALVLLIVGYFLSRSLSYQVRKRFLSHFRLHQSASEVIQWIVHYLLLATFALFALRLANIPLH